MIKVERDRCAELVEQIRALFLGETTDLEDINNKRDAVRDLCDQLIMKLQPITIRYPKPLKE